MCGRVSGQRAGGRSTGERRMLGRLDPAMRHLVLVLGDRLNRDSAAFDGFDAARDRVWMSETPHETTTSGATGCGLRSSSPRCATSRRPARGRHCGRLCRARAASRGRSGHHLRRPANLALAREQADRLIVVEPGDWRVREELLAGAARQGVRLEIRPDRTFLCSTADLSSHAGAHRGLPLDAPTGEERVRIRGRAAEWLDLLGRPNRSVV